MKKKYEETHIQAIADVIREKVGTNKKYKTEEMADGVAEAYITGAGTTSIYDIVLNKGKRTNCEYAFYRWACEYIRPPFVFKPTSRTIYCFANNTALKKIEKQYFDFSGCPVKPAGGTAGHYYLFYYCINLEIMEDIGLPASGYDMTWGACIKLHTIELVRSTKETKFSNSFNQCTALVNIRFDGEIGENISFFPCGKLSDESVDDIIDHLADLTGETARTITWHSSVFDKLTEEQMTKMINKNWNFD